jgi:hypothetical protein
MGSLSPFLYSRKSNDQYDRPEISEKYLESSCDRTMTAKEGLGSEIVTFRSGEKVCELLSFFVQDVCECLHDMSP